MKSFILALALAGFLAFPVFAQSYDPDFGTGNIAPLAKPSVAGSVQGTASATSPLRSEHAAFAAVTPFGSARFDRNAETLAAARAKTIQECSARAAPYRPMTWGTMELYQYRACMALRGQRE